MTAEHTTRRAMAQDGAAVLPLTPRPGPPTDGDLRERLGEFRALLVISLLMTESANEDQILELATSSAAGLGPWRIEGYRFTDGQWHAGLGHGATAPARPGRAAGRRWAARAARSAWPAAAGPGPTRCAVSPG